MIQSEGLLQAPSQLLLSALDGPLQVFQGFLLSKVFQAQMSNNAQTLYVCRICLH